MKREEELLAQALERYWDWRWENLPSREEILDMHRFSPEFLRNMENLEKKKIYCRRAGRRPSAGFGGGPGVGAAVEARRRRYREVPGR